MAEGWTIPNPYVMSTCNDNLLESYKFQLPQILNPSRRNYWCAPKYGSRAFTFTLISEHSVQTLPYPFTVLFNLHCGIGNDNIRLSDYPQETFRKSCLFCGYFSLFDWDNKCVAAWGTLSLPASKWDHWIKRVLWFLHLHEYEQRVRNFSSQPMPTSCMLQT